MTTILHVDPSGNHNNDGTAAKPYNTLARAASKLPNGGHIVWHGGQYPPQKVEGGRNITIEAVGHVVVDGGLSAVVDACYREDYTVEVTEDMRKVQALLIKDCESITVQAAVGGSLTFQNAGRGVYVYNSRETLLQRIKTTRILYRAVGGWFDGLTLEDSTIDETSLCNYGERLRKMYGRSGGWPAAVTGTEDYKLSGIPAKRLAIRRCHFGRGWGESVGFFSTDGGEVVDCTFVDSSHTVAIYLQQCRNVTVRGNSITFTPHAPRKTKNGRAELAHGIQIAREGTGFRPRSEGLVIENNTVIGGNNGLQVAWSEYEEDYSGLLVQGNTILHQTGYAIHAPADSMMHGTAEVTGNILGLCKIERGDWLQRYNLFTTTGEPLPPPPQPDAKTITVSFHVQANAPIQWELGQVGEA
ncbi:MAG: right-handed parallel beta-helix repeat-containing protein [Chloroflexi bacterium]|nr:right-handed parallel beta-helix repeat-containing protein [Chloroflexota bacterium]